MRGIAEYVKVFCKLPGYDFRGFMGVIGFQALICPGSVGCKGFHRVAGSCRRDAVKHAPEIRIKIFQFSNKVELVRRNQQ